MKTYSPKKSEITKQWVHFDAKNAVLGRLAVEVARRLRGKHKAVFTSHVDDGDYVVVTNVRHIHLTGQKKTQKTFYWHTGYPGGIRHEKTGQTLEGRFPERALLRAVKGMLPRGPLGRAQLKNLKIYADDQHQHQAQKPITIDFAANNAKNIARTRQAHG